MTSYLEAVYSLKIDKFSQLKAQGTANVDLEILETMNHVKYGPVYLGGNLYEIRVYPWSGSFTIHIHLLENSVTSKKHGFVLLFQTNNGYWRCISNNNEFRLRASGVHNLHVLRELAYSAVEEEYQCKDDCLFLKIVFWVGLDGSDSPAKPMLPSWSNPPNYSTPPDVITTLLTGTGQTADIHITVKDQVFAAHRAVLAARSSVFRSELVALQSESGDDMCWNGLHISVQHVDALTFKYLLHFIYTDSLPPDFEEATPPERYHLMLIAAHRFEIEGLVPICEEKLTMVVAQTIVTTLKLIEHQEGGLLKIVPKDCNMKLETVISAT